MAKAAKNLNTELLVKISNGSVTRVSEKEGLPLVEKGLIEVNPHDIVDNKALVRLTEEGINIVNTLSNKSDEIVSPYAIMSGVPLPASKRGNRGTGAPKQYPFDDLPVGGSFFVPVSEKHPNPLKSMQSTVSSANHKYSEETGETKYVERVKRGPGNRALTNAEGGKIYEQVNVKIRKPLRKFVIRPVKAGETHGPWTAPKDGVIIGRIEI